MKQIFRTYKKLTFATICCLIVGFPFFYLQGLQKLRSPGFQTMRQMQVMQQFLATINFCDIDDDSEQPTSPPPTILSEQPQDTPPVSLRLKFPLNYEDESLTFRSFSRSYTLEIVKAFKSSVAKYFTCLVVNQVVDSSLEIGSYPGISMRIDGNQVDLICNDRFDTGLCIYLLEENSNHLEQVCPQTELMLTLPDDARLEPMFDYITNIDGIGSPQSFKYSLQTLAQDPVYRTKYGSQNSTGHIDDDKETEEKLRNLWFAYGKEEDINFFRDFCYNVMNVGCNQNSAIAYLNITSESEDVMDNFAPAKITQFHESLKELHLAANINAMFPPKFEKLKQLEIFSMSGKIKLEGTLPGAIGDMINLKELYLNDVHESNAGQLPAEMGNLVNLEILDLGKMGFEGTIKPFLYENEKLLILHLHKNYFSGTISWKIGLLNDLISLSLGKYMVYNGIE